jgi:hypothetical protein
MLNKSCNVICAVAMAAFWTTSIGGQERDARPDGASDSWGAHLTAVVVVSAQPGTGSQNPYLDVGLGATRPGLTVGFGVETSESPLITSVELSTTAAMETTQRGRFIPGMGPAVARQRDTLLSILPGVRWRAGGGAMELKGGLSIRFGEPTQGGERVQDYEAGRFALTTGFDAVFPLTDHIGLIPSFRYSLLDRSNTVDYVGLGKHITRAGVGLRVRLNGD